MYIIYLHKVESVATRETDPKGETFIVAIFHKLFSSVKHLFYAYGYILESYAQFVERKHKHSRKKNIQKEW